MPIGFMPVLISPGMTTLTPTGASMVVLGAQHVRQTEDTVLGHRVRPEPGARWHCRHRGHVDDVTLLTRGEDPRHEGTDAMDVAPEVDVQDAVPLLQRQLPRVATVDDASVVHRDVQRADAIDGGLSEPVDAIGVTVIDRGPPHGTSLLPEPRPRARS